MTQQASEKPALTRSGLTFFPVPEVTRAVAAFGLGGDHYFRRDDRPDGLPEKYEDCVDDLFFSGGKMPDMKPEVDRQAAAMFLRALLSSFAPPHEAKIRTAAYALWVWCEGDLS